MPIITIDCLQLSGTVLMWGTVEEEEEEGRKKLLTTPTLLATALRSPVRCDIMKRKGQGRGRGFFRLLCSTDTGFCTLVLEYCPLCVLL